MTVAIVSSDHPLEAHMADEKKADPGQGKSTDTNRPLGGPAKAPEKAPDKEPDKR